MTNEQMKPGRFLKLAKARRMFRFIMANLEAGNTVSLTTHTRSTNYKPKHIAMFKLAGSSCYVRRGCALVAGKPIAECEEIAYLIGTLPPQK